MKINQHAVLLAALTACVATSMVAAAPVGTAINYQGQLKQGGVPVSDKCDFEFRLFDAESTPPGSQIGPTLIFDGGAGNSPPIDVVNGLFEAALDFGSEALSGEARWIEFNVCCSLPCSASFTTLSPRQELTPAPYALALPAMRVEENGPDLPADCLGTLLFGGPNVIGGWHGNTVAAGVQGATIAGGGDNNIASGMRSAVGSGQNNNATGDHAIIPGGQTNLAGGDFSFAAGRRARVRRPADVGGTDLDGDEGTFVWADSGGSNGTIFTSTGPDQFLIRAVGGVGIGTPAPSEQLDVVGNIKASGTIRSGNSIVIDGVADTITASGGVIGFAWPWTRRRS